MTYIHYPNDNDGPIVTNMAVRENWKSTAPVVFLRS